jgi:type IV secretion system protein VirD4
VIGHLGAGALALGALLAAVVAGTLRSRVRAAGIRPQASQATRRSGPPPAVRPGTGAASGSSRRDRGGFALRPWGAPRAGTSGPADADVARWARRADLVRLAAGSDVGGRLVLGELQTGGLRRPSVIAAERAQSLAVIGPTQSGKTTALAVPAILRWAGPVLAASVKTDLVRDTLASRRSRGEVWCFDPAGTTGLPQSRWSPLDAATSWSGARRAAADLTAVSRGDGTTADGDFWYATAAKLLAPLLFAAAAAGLTMRDVVRWVDTQETEEVGEILHASGVPEAMQAARATWLRDDRTRSAVYTTAETVLEPFGEPELVISDPATGRASVAPSLCAAGALSQDTPPYGLPAVCRGPAAPELRGPGEIRAQRLLEGPNTLYVCAPAHDQRRLRAVFAALVEQVINAAFARASRLGRPLDPPLLVVLDEAANIAPLRDLDGLAATCAGHGVQLVTVWQDLAQVRARFGERASTVVNNHRAKLFLPGIADPGTLDFASHLAGEREVTVPSTSVGSRGERTLTTSTQVRRLLPADALRRVAPGQAVLLYGSLPPARLRLRPWFTDPELASAGGTRRG